MYKSVAKRPEVFRMWKVALGKCDRPNFLTKNNKSGTITFFIKNVCIVDHLKRISSHKSKNPALEARFFFNLQTQRLSLLKMKRPATVLDDTLLRYLPLTSTTPIVFFTLQLNGKVIGKGAG